MPTRFGLAHSVLSSSHFECWAPQTIQAVAPEKIGDKSEIIGEVLTDDGWAKSSWIYSYRQGKNQIWGLEDVR